MQSNSTACPTSSEQFFSPKCRSGEHVGDSRSAKNYPISSESPSHGQLRLSLHMRAELYDNE